MLLIPTPSAPAVVTNGAAATMPACTRASADPNAVRLETERLVLREFGPRDWRRLYEIESDPEAVRYQSFGPRTAAESRAYIRLCVRDRAKRPRRVYDLA